MANPGTAAGVDFLATFVAAAARFGDTIASADLHARVPACPGWTVRDLVVHLGNVHAWAATIVETGAAAVTQNDEPRSHRSRVYAEWYAGKAEDLYAVLRSTDPARPTWNFAFGEGQAGFWRRRQLHETTIHCVDLDQAEGRPPRIAAEVASDGVDEVLTVMLHRMHHRGHPVALVAPLSLLCEDTGRAWTLTPRPLRETPGGAVPVQARGSDTEAAPPRTGGPPLVVDRRHPQADLLSGPAATMYQALWKRAPYDALTRFGDDARVEAFLASRLVP